MPLPERARRRRQAQRFATRTMVVGATIATLMVSAAVLVIPQTRQYVLYGLTSTEGTRGDPIDRGYANPSLTDEAPQAADVSSPPLRIAVAGDVGTGGAAEYATAASMDRIEGQDEYAALLLLGDNIYPDGDPAEVQRRVLDPFASVLDGGTQLLPVLGNHDNDDGYGDEQLAALGMPGRWYATKIENTLIVSLDSNRSDDTEQLRWLEATLAANESTWTIVQFHHPPYSGGWHGSDNGVRATFVPLFERYGVDLVLSGHDHDYQRSGPINGVTYVVSGAAAQLRKANLADFAEVALSINHFVDVTITADRMEVRAVDHDDHVFDQVSLVRS